MSKKERRPSASPPESLDILLAEVPLQQPLEGFAMPCYVPGHLLHGAANGVQVEGLLRQADPADSGKRSDFTIV